MMEFCTVMVSLPLLPCGVNVVVRRETHGDVVENHVRAVADVDAVLAVAGREAGTDADIADDFILSGTEGNFVADDADAAAGRGLSGNGQIARATDTRC